MTRRRAGGPGAAAVAVVLAVLGTGAPAAALEVPTSPDDLPTPTARQLAASVQVWEPGGVQVWDPSGSVEQLESQEQDGGETVLTLASDILFVFDSAELPASAGPRLEELVADLPDGAEVEVTGHTDALGGDDYNLDLSRRRAQAVADVVAGARPDLVLAVEGRGSAEPVAPETSSGEDDPEGRAQNRRVEIRYGG